MVPSPHRGGNNPHDRRRPLDPSGVESPSDVRELFTRNGLRVTRQREVLFEALARTRRHPTAEELFEAVRAIEPGLSLATVYNTLEALTEAGLCRRLPTPTGPCRFDADLRDHAHAVMGDGRVLDLPSDLSGRLAADPDWIRDVERRLGVKVKGVSIQVMVEPRSEAD